MPQLASCSNASSGRAPPGERPAHRLLERAASKVADVTALSTQAWPGANPNLGQAYPTPTPTPTPNPGAMAFQLGGDAKLLTCCHHEVTGPPLYLPCISRVSAPYLTCCHREVTVPPLYLP